MKSTLLRISAILSIAFLSIIGFNGCSTFKGKDQGIAFDHRDFVILPKGTVIKNVPFYLQGAENPPTLSDYTTSEEGGYFSMTAQKVLKK